MINIMELVEKEDGRKKKTPFVDYVLWRGTLEGMIDDRAEQYPTIAMCLKCDRLGKCKYAQAEVVGFYYYYCGIKNKEWRK